MYTKSLVYTSASAVFWGVSFIAYFFCVSLVFLSLLVPYPPAGTLLRDINDFFAAGNNAEVLLWVTMAASLLFIIVAGFKAHKLRVSFSKFLTYLAVLNCFFIALIIIFIVAGMNYYNWPAIIGTVGSLVLIWYLQVSLFFIKPKLAAIAKVD